MYLFLPLEQTDIREKSNNIISQSFYGFYYYLFIQTLEIYFFCPNSGAAKGLKAGGGSCQGRGG